MLLVMLLSCSKEQIDLAERIPAGITDGFCLVIGDSLLITHEEIVTTTCPPIWFISRRSRNSSGTA